MASNGGNLGEILMPVDYELGLGEVGDWFGAAGQASGRLVGLIAILPFVGSSHWLFPPLQAMTMRCCPFTRKFLGNRNSQKHGSSLTFALLGR